MAEKTEEVVARRPKPKAQAAATTPLKGTTAAKAASTEEGAQRVSGPLPQKTAPKGASTGATTPETPTKSASPMSFFRRLGGSKEQTTAPASAATTKGGATAAPGTQRPANPGMGRFFFGMMLYMVLAFAAQFVLAFVFGSLDPKKGQEILFTVPVLGPITAYLLVWMLVLIGILWGLYKLKILPRSLGQPRERVATAKADPKAAKAAEVKAPREPLSGPNDDAYERVKARLRSERRKARRH